jgi:hypothetical protein
VEDRSELHAIFEVNADDPYLVLAHEGLDAAVARFTDWASGRMDHDRAGL